MSSHRHSWIVLAITLLLGLPGLGATEKVDCDKGKSLQGAIDKAEAGDVIEVNGTCNELIVFDVTRQGLTVTGLAGAAIVSPDPNRATVDINLARGVRLSNLSIGGGATGLLVRSGQAVVADTTLSGSFSGLSAFNNSRIVLLESTVSGPGRGIVLFSGVSAFVRNITLAGITDVAFQARLDSAFRVFNLTVGPTPGTAIEVSENSAGTISGLNLQDAGVFGINLHSGGSLEVSNARITNATISSFDGLLQMNGVTLDGQGQTGPGIGANGGSIRLRSSRILGFESGLLADDSATMELRGTTLTGQGSAGFGIEIASGASVKLQDGSVVQGFGFGVVASSQGVADIKDSTLEGDNRGLWVTGGAAHVERSEINGGSDAISVESGRIAVVDSTIHNSLGLNYSSSAEVLRSRLLGSPSLSPGFSSSVRIQETTMESVTGVRSCSLQFLDGTVVTGTIRLDVGCALDLTPNDPGTFSLADIECEELDVTTQVRLGGVTSVGTISNCKVTP